MDVTITVSMAQGAHFVNEQRFRDVSEWLTRLDASYCRLKDAGWEFFFNLRDGVDQFGTNDDRRMELYDLAANQLGIARKTLQNYVSAARSAKAQVAFELGLEYGHVTAVLGLDDDVAEDMLYTAAEHGWAPPQIAKEAWARKAIPSNGNGHNPPPSAMEYADDEPPTNNESYYAESDRADRIARLICPHCGKEFAG